jgi:hypothetical protein
MFRWLVGLFGYRIIYVSEFGTHDSQRHECCPAVGEDETGALMSVCVNERVLQMR